MAAWALWYGCFHFGFVRFPWKPVLGWNLLRDTPGVIRGVKVKASIRLIWTLKNHKNNKQECIPVGCVPPAAVAVLGGLHQANPLPPGEQAPLPRDQTPSPPPRSRHPSGTRHPPRSRHPSPVNRITYTCKKHYLPATSFAGGKERKLMLNLKKPW